MNTWKMSKSLFHIVDQVVECIDVLLQVPIPASIADSDNAIVSRYRRRSSLGEHNTMLMQELERLVVQGCEKGELKLFLV